MDYQFHECKVCDDKPGSPDLCESCLHNRTVIEQQAKEIKKLRERLAVLKILINWGLLI